MAGFRPFLAIFGGSVISRHVARFVFWGNALFLLIISAVMVIGRAQSSISEQPLTSNPCAFPCMLGIVPGQTTREDAIQILLSIGLTPDAGQNMFVRTASPPTDEVETLYIVQLQSNADNQVSWLRLIAGSNSELSYLGDLLSKGEHPVRLFRACTGMFPFRMMMVFGEYQQVIVELLIDSEISPFTPILLVDSSEPGTRSVFDARASFGCSVEVRWRGFAPLWRYMRDDVSS